MSRVQLQAVVTIAVAWMLATPLIAAQATQNAPDTGTSASDKAEGHRFEPFKPESVTSSGTVSIDGHAMSYQAIAGTLVVHPKGWDDVPHDPNRDKPGTTEDGAQGGGNPTAEASMFYVAYSKTELAKTELAKAAVAAVPSPSFSTAARGRRHSGSTWEPSARAAS